MDRLAAVKERVGFIDIAKGIGILLVVLAHTVSVPEGIKQFCGAFDMALFFVVSGWLFNGEKAKETSVAEYIRKNLKSYIRPYFAIGIFCWLVFGVIIPIAENGGGMSS